MFKNKREKFRNGAFPFPLTAEKSYSTLKYSSYLQI